MNHKKFRCVIEKGFFAAALRNFFICDGRWNKKEFYVRCFQQTQMLWLSGGGILILIVFMAISLKVSEFYSFMVFIILFWGRIGSDF